jgi:predicted MFS family arabinose efflux permease
MPSIMLGDIMQQFHIDAFEFGQLSGIYYLGYTAAHLPIGIMLDRYGPKKIMTGCILLMVVGLLPIIFSDKWIYSLLGRALIGMGSSAAILGTFKIIRMTFNEKLFPRMLSISVTIGLIGAIYGGGPINYLSSALGYKTVVEILAYMGLFLAAFTYIIVPNISAEHKSTVLSDIKTVFTNIKLIWVCVFAGLMLGPLEGFADVWGIEFFKQVYGFDAIVASYLPSMIYIGMCFGSPVLNFIAEKIHNYFGVVVGSGVVMAIVFTLLVVGALTQTTIAVSFILVGVCCAYQILAIYKASTYVPEHVTGLTTAVANMIIMAFGFIFHTVIGFVINICGGIHVSKAFVYGIAVIPIALCIGVIGFAFITYQESKLK